MLCEICKKNKASVTIQKGVGNSQKIQHLCSSCASEQPFMGLDNLFGNFFSDSIFGNLFGEQKNKESEERLDIFDYFSQRARESLERAETIARKTIDTEHLLLAILQDNEIIPKILKKLNINKNALEESVKKLIPNEQARDNEKLTFSPRAKRALELAFDEAMEMGHSYVGTEHLLLGLSLEGEGLASQTLEEHEMNYKKIKEVIEKELGKGEKKTIKRQSQTPILDQYSR